MFKGRAALPLLLTFLFGFLPAFAAPRSGRDLKAAVERLRAATGEPIEVRWAESGDRIRTIAGRLAPPRAGTPEEAARTFLLENKDLLGLDERLTGLTVRSVRTSPGGTHIAFDQEHAGLPVFDGGLDVHLDAAGGVSLVQSAYAEELPRTATSAIPAPAATQAALRHFGAASRTATDKQGRPMSAAPARPTGEPRLGILAGHGSPALVYRVELFSESPVALVESFVDAESGSILLTRNLVQTAATGQGKVFDPNPVVVLDDPTLRDEDDAASPAFDPAYTAAPLPAVRRLYLDLLGPYVLVGPYVRVADATERPYSPLVTSPDARFQFTRDAQGFEAVMTYFHIDRNQRYIQSLGFLDVNNRMLRADPHGLFGADNSHYVPLPFGAGWVAFGEGGVDDAEDADVILHEYGHAIQDNQNPARFLPFGETGAMGEGFGDYWAFSNSPQDGFDPPCIAEWDFEGTCLRRVDGDKHYPEDIAGEVHADGEIWSALLHDVFGALGKETTDRIVLESHFLVPRAPRFCDGADALRRAATALYGDAETSAIGAAAAGRGIAGDLTFAPVGPGPALPLRFAITNLGPCAVGPARHAIVLVTPTGDVLAGHVETADLAPGAIASLQFDPPGALPGQIYRVVADADGDETETSESNNVLQFPPIPPPLFGRHPVFGSAEAVTGPAEAMCDYTAILQGFLCQGGLPLELFAAPFPTVTMHAGYTAATLRAGVTDPDSTPALSDILLVAASYLAPLPGGGATEVSFHLPDDGGASAFTFEQAGTRAERCTVDPAAQVCECLPAHYPVTSHDPVEGDDVYTRVLALVKSGPATPPGDEAYAVLLNCIARAEGLSPIGGLPQGALALRFEAVDRSGNLAAWPELQEVEVEPASLSCSGDACGCCVLMSADPSADPAAGGCAGLPGLAGVAGSGFENGLCVTFWP